MNILLLHCTLTLILLVILFFLSRRTINQLFNLLRIFFKSDRTVFALIALIFFPGTVLHELAHFLTAVILFLQVREFKILPERKDNYLKLGHVLYERKDFIRGFLVGIAPLFAGTALFFLIFNWKLFPNQNLLINILLIYLIFAVSSTMFSSQQDLKELIYIPLLTVFIYGVIYIFNLKLNFLFQNGNFSSILLSFLTQLNFFLLLPLSIHLGTILLLTIFLRKRP